MNESSGDPKHLYVFLDEAGNFDFSPRGSQYFILTAVSRARPMAWDASVTALRYDLMEAGQGIEYFHASEDTQPVRDRVFEIIAGDIAAVRADALIVEKSKTYPSLRSEEVFYPRMLGYLMRYILKPGMLRTGGGVTVITDRIPVRKKRVAVESAVKHTLSSAISRGIRHQILHHESRSIVGLQVADYINWAVFRKWERQDVRSYDLICPALRSEFDLFRRGNKRYY